MSQQPAAQPKSLLRGHRSQVHVTAFIRQSQRLASGDADGFVVLWDLTIMRPRAVWRAHTGAILGISGWGPDKLITEGRDNRLIVWKIAAVDEATLSTALPLDESAADRPQPWILHILEINTMNFCSFAQCPPRPDTDLEVCDELLVAVPNTLTTEAVDIFHLPSQKRQATVHLGSNTEKKGMVMALSLFWLHGSLLLLAGYENGLAIVAQRGHGEEWVVLYKCQAHSQPILSLDVAPNREYFLTSGADAMVVKHPIPLVEPATPLVPVTQETGISERGGNGTGSRAPKQESSETNPSLLSIGLASAKLSNPWTEPCNKPKTAARVETSPLKVLDTKHSGQQGLQIRSDGRIFVTAGWDSKIRVYSTKTMTELAVLKWHGVGCYATAFAVLADGQTDASGNSSCKFKQEDEVTEQATPSSDHRATERKETRLAILSRPGGLSVKHRRIKMAKQAHWLAAGSKDGKISLWDIY